MCCAVFCAAIQCDGVVLFCVVLCLGKQLRSFAHLFCAFHRAYYHEGASLEAIVLYLSLSTRCTTTPYLSSQVRTAEREGDVVLVVTDVYGEPLHDKKIMDK